MATVSLRANCVLPENFVPPAGFGATGMPAVAMVGLEAATGTCAMEAASFGAGITGASAAGAGTGIEINSFFSSTGGAGFESACGWLSNKFAITFSGISRSASAWADGTDGGDFIQPRICFQGNFIFPVFMLAVKSVTGISH